MTSVYPEEWFADLLPGCSHAAERILPLLWKKKSFSSVIDVGCGTGAWLKVAQELGASAICGIEGAVLPRDLFCVSPECIRVADLNQPLAIESRFDLCLCLEVAEHLEPRRARDFVAELTALSDNVLFSAAIPSQGGYHHVNEQWPDFWATLFSNHEFDVWDGIRMQIWSESEIPWWDRQNTLLFVKQSAWDTLLAAETPSNLSHLSIVHPDCYWRPPMKVYDRHRL